MPVLALRRKRRLATENEESDSTERTGVFTSGIVSTAQKQTIALFFTGRQHAGENLADVLRQRAAELAPPMQMCDALSRNLPKLPEKLEVIVGHCLAHARRRFVEVIENFPQPCRHVLEQLGTVYGNDATARKQAMTAEERWRYHQQHSAPVMEELRAWLTAQFAEKKVEPNSGLGMAMRYLLKHWERLTLFLRQPGAPLDNNIAERALKKAILHRKNSLFYKTANGARVGDLFMSLIHTCELSGANPFDYLTQLQLHAGELARKTGLSTNRIAPGFWPGAWPKENSVSRRLVRPRVYPRPADSSHAEPRPAGVRRASGLDRRHAGERGGLRCGTTRGARETARSRAPPRDRHRAGVAIGSLGTLGHRPAQHAAGTGTSRRRFRFADRSAGPDHARRSGHGRAAGGICGVRARDSARTGARWFGSCPAEWQTPGPTRHGGPARRSGRKLRRAGLSKSAIARRLHMGRTSVRRILKERIRS